MTIKLKTEKITKITIDSEDSCQITMSTAIDEGVKIYFEGSRPQEEDAEFSLTKEEARYFGEALIKISQDFTLNGSQNENNG